jgi:hypothetical protein
MTLTDQWQPFTGEYEKQVYAIRTRNGKEYDWAWPNAGCFNLDSSNKIIQFKDVTHVKKGKKFD